ncbi:Der GTPase-activating protein YihI [Alteromonas sp. C1M14]|uniref:Der GTPase-activating protein YihI n=1 Tax=Alteromonas sp. C1M14 TaxID=2841567 RepID=UPI001C08A5AD|nr:Der GTPase-activating protein YihI [Alteromonas sp. C1M14]MBU2978455.1 GTPase-activating protein [Alteromonas sp. C1M14]
MSSRSKKSRKIGMIGVRKDPDFKPEERKNKGKVNTPKSKRRLGNPAGSRNSVENTQKSNKPTKVNQDPRHGSKKPVPLVKAPVKTQAQKKYATPADELAALEADTKLASLLDKLDSDKAISRAEQQYVDEKMARHRILCDLLGITETDDDEDDVDPLAQLDAISLDEFKD